jgi:hypothetical protein
MPEVAPTMMIFYLIIRTHLFLSILSLLDPTIAPMPKRAKVFSPQKNLKNEISDQ